MYEFRLQSYLNAQRNASVSKLKIAETHLVNVIYAVLGLTQLAD